MKRACFYVIATHLGGAEKSLLELVKGLKEDPLADWTPRVILPKKEGPLVDELVRTQIDFRVVEIPESFLKITRARPFYSLFKFFQSIPALIGYLKKVNDELLIYRPLVIHTTGLKCHILGLVFSRWRRIPIVWHLRDIFNPGPTLTLLRFLIRCQLIELVCNSKATAAPFASASSKINVVYNGLNPSEYYPNPNSKYRDHFRVGLETTIIGIVGAFASWKGQLQFLEAAALLVKAGIQARFVIVGGEIYDTGGETGLMLKYKQKSEDLGIGELVLFTGFEHDAARVMNSIQILVHASIRPEAFGRVIIEAMACGTAVVASKRGAAPEFFDHGEVGLLVDPNHPQEIAKAVQWLVENPSDRERMVARAKTVFLSRFTHERYVAELKNVFNFAAKS